MKVDFSDIRNALGDLRAGIIDLIIANIMFIAGAIMVSIPAPTIIRSRTDQALTAASPPEAWRPGRPCRARAAGSPAPRRA